VTQMFTKATPPPPAPTPIPPPTMPDPFSPAQREAQRKAMSQAMVGGRNSAILTTTASRAGQTLAGGAYQATKTGG
jgi:hypothetical protein